MYIFIDEAGGFQIPSQPNLVSCVTALLVPESFARTLFRKFRRVTRPWKSAGHEVKGSQLAEDQMAAVIRAVRRFDVLLIGIAIDMGLHSDPVITLHRKGQVDRVFASVLPAVSTARRTKIENLAKRIGALPNQLYVQMLMLTLLIQAVVEAGTLYYVQRIPKTLGSFTWRLDAKDKSITEYERLWQDMVGPLLQTMSLSSPNGYMKGADYSAFDRYCGTVAEAPEHLRNHLPRKGEPLEYIDIDALLSDLRFCASHRVTGIQMVDMLGAAIRRACNDRLQPAGWKGLGRLMPSPRRGEDCVPFIALEDVRDDALPYSRIIKGWNRETRQMIPQRRGPTSR
jgi:hypothetical protein